MKNYRMVAAGALLIVLVLGAVSSAFASGKPLQANLDWRNVVPAGTGDPNGWGDATVRVSVGQGELCYALSVIFFYGSPATGAHIHQGAAGQTGPIVIDLGRPMPPPDSYTTTGCVRASPALLKDMQQNPTMYYLQVTNDTHPDGAIRGQLHN